MSKTIDEKVVSMRFDNQHFERNVQTSLSTLDKLKQKLNLSGAAKGLEGINEAAKNNKIGVLGNAATDVGRKFSALEVMGVTALANITNSAVNAGKRIVKSLTIDPIKTGFQEYELKMNSIQTIMASTGEELEVVNKHLNELNEYSDKTIYSFSDMTQNIGKFTNAGVKLEDAVLAMKGISNEAALSGANANEASRAMYNFAQALSVGYIQRIDWKSIELANMATVEFKEQLLAAAIEMGTVKKNAEGMYATIANPEKYYNSAAMFTETLDDQWLTTEVLIGTLKDYADETTDIGSRATKAATEVKTFTQMMDALRESAQSGWARTWEIIFGDFYQGKTLWTNINNVVDGLLGKMSDARNEFLESALGMSFKELGKVVDKALGPIDKVAKGTKKATSALEDLDKIVNKVIRGDFGNGEKRLNELTEAGYNYYKVQNKVNETLGDSYRHSKELIESQEKLLNNQEKTTEQTEKTAKGKNAVTEADAKLLKQMAKMSKEQLKANGYTEEQIEGITELKKVSKELGLSMDELIDNIDEIDGRWILLNSFRNIWESIASVAGTVGAAFRDVFGVLKPEKLFDVIVAFHRLTENMQLNTDVTENLTRIFKGLFSAVDVVSRVLGGGIRVALTIITTILDAFGLSTLDAVAGLADLITKFDEWLKKNDYIAKAVEKIAEKLPPLVEDIKEFAKSLYIDSGIAENFHKIAGGFESIWNVIHGQFVWTLNSSLKILKSVLELFGTNFSEVLAVISEYISKAVDWIASNTMLIDGVKKVSEIIFLVVDGVLRLIKAFAGLESVQKFVSNIADAFKKLFDSFDFDFEFKGTALDTLYNWISETFTKIEKWIKGLDTSESFQAGLDIINGLVLGLESGIKDVAATISEIANTVITKFKEILQIHSPSKVMIAIGGYIIAGLIHGLVSGEFKLFQAIGDLVANVVDMFVDLIQNGMPAIWDTIKEIGSQFANNIKENGIDFGAVFVVGGALVAIYFLVQIKKLLEKILNPVENFGKVMNSLTGVLDQFRENMKLKKWTVIAECIKTVAIAFAILAGSLIAISMCDPKKLGIALAIMLGLVAELSILMVVAAKLKPEAFGKIAVMVLSLSVAMLLMASAIRKIGKMDPGEAIMGISVITAVVGLMAGLIYVCGKLDWKQLRGLGVLGRMMWKLAVAVGVMALALKIVGSMSARDAFQGTLVITAMMGMMIAFAKLGDMKTKNPFQIGNMFAKMAGAMLILAVALKIVGTMSVEDITKGVIVFTGFTLMFFALNKASALATKTSPLAAKAFMSFAGAVLIMAFALKLLSSMSGEEIIQGMLAIAGIEMIFEMYAKVSAKAGKSKANAAKGFMSLAIGIGVMALAIRLLAGMEVGDIIKGMIVVGLMEGLFILAGNSLSTVGRNVDKVGIMFTKMAAAILILVGAIAVLSILEPDNVIRGTACISALILCFAALAGVTKFAKNTKQMQKTMLEMAIIIGAFAGIIALLSLCDPDSVVASTAALSGLMLSFAASLLIIGKAGRISTTVSKQMFPMLAVVAGLAGIIAGLSLLDTDNALEATLALSILLEAFAASFVILGTVGRISTTATKNVWMMLGVVAGLALIMGALTALDVAPSIETATSLSIMLLSLSAALGILGFVGLIPIEFIANGLLGFVMLIGILGSLIIAIAGINRLCKGELERLLDEGLPLMEKIGAGLGRFVGGIIGGIGEGITNSLPKMAENLSSFMENLEPFIEGSKQIDGDTVSGIVNLTKAVAAISGANFLDKLTMSWNGETSIEQFAEKLDVFSDAILDFSDKMSGTTIDLEAINQTVKAGEALAGLAEVIPKTGGLKQVFGGENDLAEFGTQLYTFGTAIIGYSAVVSQGVNLEAIKQSANAGKALAKMAEEIPDNGKLWNMFGTSNIQQFSIDLGYFGAAIVGFSQAMVNAGGINTDYITQAAKAGKALAKMASEIPESGKLFGMFGESDLETFSTDLPLFGAAISAFSKSLTENGGIDSEAVTTAAKAGKELAKMAKQIPEDGRLFNMFGDSELETFSNDLATFGTAICGFAESVADLDVDAVTAAEPAIKSLKKSIKGLKDIDTSGVSSFKSAISMLAGADIDGFIETFKGKSADLEGIGKSLSGTLITGIKAKKEESTSSGKSLLTAFKSGINSDKESLVDTGKSLANKLKSGLDDKKSSIKKSGKDLADESKSGAREKYDGMKKAGKYLGDGLVAGIEAKEDDAYDAGYALGQAAVQGEKDGQASASPSKLTYQAGIWIGEGLIGGMIAMGKRVYNTGLDLGERAANSMTNAVGKIASIVDMDLDVQPVISPVLDLSDVRAGASAIGGLLSADNIGVSANLGAISSMMSKRNQNGNADVVSAINKLHKGLDNLGNTNYTIEGITYDEGSGVADAIRAITRAAIVERRA